MRGIRATFLLLFLSVVASPAAAVTTDQVVALKKSGVSDAVILALIERDRTVFTIAPEQIVALQREGLSEALIIAMLRSGQEADEAARAESSYASAVVAAAIAPGPEILIVGHGPDASEHLSSRRFLHEFALAGTVSLPAVLPAVIRAALQQLPIGSAVPVARALLRPDEHERKPGQLAELCHRVSPSAAASSSLALSNPQLVSSRIRVWSSYENSRSGCRCRARSADRRVGCVVLANRGAIPFGRLRAGKSRETLSRAENRRRVHQTDQAASAGSAHHHRARRSPAGLGHRAVAAQVPGPRGGDAGRADVREGHPSLLRGARESGAHAREVLEDRHQRGRPRHRRARDCRRGDDQVARFVSQHARRADRSAEDQRRAGAAAAQRRPSRSTTRSAACTRRKTAGPKC